MSKLTVRQLESLSQKDIGRKLFDTNGLYGRVRKQKTGIVVTFEYRYKQHAANGLPLHCEISEDQGMKNALSSQLEVIR